MRHLYLRLGLVTAMGVLVACATAYSQAPAKAPPALGELHAAIRAEDYAKAKLVAENLMQSGPVADRQAAGLIYGRILLAQGQTAEAKKYLAQARTQKLDDNSKQLLEVYQAWLDALSGKHADAAKALQAILVRQAAYESTAEAAEVLAQLHILKGEREPAKNAVDFGLQFLKYQQIQSAYVEALLRRRLELAKNATSDPAEALYRQAESLRNARTFAEAAAIYERIRKEHAASDWSHAAGFRIGQCLAGAGRFPEALKHWDGFLKELPTGPWRAQAHVGVIDLSLEESFELERASKHAALATDVLGRGVEGKAGPSWLDAAFDVHLRAGIVALIERKHAGAAVAFEQARSAKGAGEALAGLDELIAEAKAGREIAPEEVRQGSPQVAVALAMGTVYNLVRQFDRASGLFDRVAAGNLKGASPAQRAFAAYGAARSNEGRGKAVEAKQGYLASLKSYAGGSWHDETLYRLALLIQDMANREFTELAKSDVKPPTVPATAAPKTAAERAKEREREQKARNDRKKELAKDRGEALPHWLQLLRAFPKSRRIEPALYFAGVLYADADKATDALASWTTLVSQFPRGGYAGDAYVRLIDLHLELLLDLPSAEKHSQAALEWLTAVEKENAGPIASSAAKNPGARPLRAVSYDIYLRQGLVAYLNGNSAGALANFAKALPLQPPRELVVVMGTIPTGVERLVSAAKSGKKLAPEEVFEGDAKAKLCLQLAGIYYEAEDFERAIGLCNHVLDKIAKATREQRSWAYFMRGRSLHGQMLPLDGLDDFRRASEESQQASWRAKSLFYMANAVFNYERDTPRAITIWQSIVLEYPKAPEAELAEYHIGFALQCTGRLAEARQAYEMFLKNYPGSVYERAIRTHHLPKIAEAAAEPSVSKKGKTP